MQGARKENKTNAEWAIKHVLCGVHGAAKQQQVTEVVSCLKSDVTQVQPAAARNGPFACAYGWLRCKAPVAAGSVRAQLRGGNRGLRCAVVASAT